MLWLVAVPGRILAAEPPSAEPHLSETLPEAQGWWYRIEVDGQRAGWMHLKETRHQEQLTLDRHTVLELRRGALAQKVEMESRFVESFDGRPISARARQVLGALPIETDYLFTEAGVETETRHGDDVQRQRLPHAEGTWLTPGAAQRALERHLESGEASFVLRTVDPQFGTQPIDVHWQRLPEVDPQEVSEPVRRQATRWRQSQSMAPQLGTDLELNGDGRMVYSSVQMMGIEMTLHLTSKADALAQGAPPEILLRTFLRPSRVIERPRLLRRGVYDLRMAGGQGEHRNTVGEEVEEILPHLQGGVQRVERRGDTLRMWVDLDAPQQVKASPPPVLTPFLSASTYLNHNDPLVQRLRRRALKEAPRDALGRAEILRRFVADYLSDKNLASVMATASEVAQGRSGDCTEHSVLLAALLRGDGIPSRVASGLVYVERFVGQENVFGYHMWTQAYLEGHWVDLDASLGGSAFDATHIRLATSALDDDKMALMELARVAPWIGRTSIEIVETHYGEPSP